VTKNSPGRRRDVRVKMRGTSSSDDKLADDLGNAIEGTRISARRSDFSTAGKSAPGHLGLLQQYRPAADSCYQKSPAEALERLSPREQAFRGPRATCFARRCSTVFTECRAKSETKGARRWTKR
jgi:hypothetical protein